MAEAAVVSALIDIFIPMVANKLSQEVSLIVNFRKDFEFFSEQLSSIKCLLMDAGEKRRSSSVSNWLDNLEDFMADAEYLLQECGPADSMSAKLKLRLKMGRKIRKLKERLQQIQQVNAQNLKLLASALDVNAHGQARDAHSLIERRERSYARLQESHIVGMDGDIKVITEWTLKEDSPAVIAIVGMGGQGKTLLLQHVFNSEDVHKRFDCHVWLAISQKFVVTEVLRDMVKEFDRNEAEQQNDKKGAYQLDDRMLKNLSEEKLREKIHRNLEGKSCLFAVDDVWDRYAWEKIGLPSRTQDKVVVTTRDENVAKYLRVGDQILHKDSLSEEDSWRLFCIHAFPDDPHQCPKAVERIAHEIVNKCGGLPLALKTIGAHMAILASDLPNKWEDTLLHLHKTHGMSDLVMPSLKFSYDALPHHLKPCFLYCSVFSKNTQIESESLVHAWIAQGFVSAQLQEAFDVGCSYMEDLIDRCLLEVSEVGWNGRVNSCKMHDLLHDLAVSEQTKCLIKPGGQLERIPAEECQGLRRISFMKNEISTIEKGIQCPRLRSLLLSDNGRLTSISASFFDNMRYLCVLDLSRTSITSLPNSIGNLKLLKYLNLCQTRIQKLPESLSGLRQLQFLDVSYTNVERLHSGIDKHKYMLHLDLGWGMEHCSVGISKLIYLQTLNGVRFSLGNSGSASASALQVRDLKGLTHLRHLSIVFLSSNDDVTMEDEGTFRGMTKMLTLSVRSGSFAGLHLPTDMEAMQRLEILHLHNCFVPKWIFKLQNLMELSLTGPLDRSSADLRGLENIPNLKKLSLVYNSKRDFIEFPNEFGEAGAFPKLEELLIDWFGCLKSIPSFHEDAMRKLKCLRIIRCWPLENMPEGLMKLRNLEEVEVQMLVNDVEGFEYTKSHCWQSFKDCQIKIKVEVCDWQGGNRLRVV